MLALVTNRARAPRGVVTAAGAAVLLGVGERALLDLADHPLHRAWSAAGELAVEPLPDKEAKAARRRLDAEAAERRRAEAEALAALPRAAAARPNGEAAP